MRFIRLLISKTLILPLVARRLVNLCSCFGVLARLPQKIANSTKVMTSQFGSLASAAIICRRVYRHFSRRFYFWSVVTCHQNGTVGACSSACQKRTFCVPKPKHRMSAFTQMRGDSKRLGMSAFTHMERKWKNERATIGCGSFLFTARVRTAGVLGTSE